MDANIIDARSDDETKNFLPPTFVDLVSFTGRKDAVTFVEESAEVQPTPTTFTQQLPLTISATITSMPNKQIDDKRWFSFKHSPISFVFVKINYAIY